MDNHTKKEESTSAGVIRVRERQAEFGVYEQTFLPEIAKGIGITLKHIGRNLFGDKETRYTRTVSYPEEKVVYPDRFRGQHRLVPREDGTPRCVACFMCSTACPARCIAITAEQSDDSHIEKRPASFEIDLLKCVFCGMCVEACPEDAIRMDTGLHAEPVTNRADAIHGKVDLLVKLGKKEREAQQAPVYRGAHEHRARTVPQGSATEVLPLNTSSSGGGH